MAVTMADITKLRQMSGSGYDGLQEGFGRSWQ